jgi:hypothetical protein
MRRDREGAVELSDETGEGTNADVAFGEPIAEGVGGEPSTVVVDDESHGSVLDGEQHTDVLGSSM